MLDWTGRNGSLNWDGLGKIVLETLDRFLYETGMEFERFLNGTFGSGIYLGCDLRLIVYLESN